jgi:hypothetical protein
VKRSLQARVLGAAAFAGLLAAVAAAVGTAAPAATSQDVRPEASVVRTCKMRNESGRRRRALAERGDVRVGAIAFRQLQRIGASRRYLARRGGTYTLKTPLLVSAGKTVTVAIAEEAQADASLFYTHGAFPASVSGGQAAVTFVACPAGQRAASYRGLLGVATEFGGGFVVARPMCVPLEVWSRGKDAPVRRTVRVGVASC